MENKDSLVPIPLVLYGVPFHNVTFEETLDWIVARVREGRSVNIATANLDFVTRARHDPELQRILIDADLVLADGFPIVKLAPLFGPALKDRVTGSDLTPLLAERAAREGFSIYGLGCAEGVAHRAMEMLKERHPELKIAGTYAPPYVPLFEMNHRKILQKLKEAKPDILFVALGAPKQDKFIAMHMRDWSVPVSIGVGGSLDFITGDQKRAPRWMQRIYLEWFWRMCHNPRRLFSRYLTNVRFLLSASRQMWKIHRLADRPVTFEPIEDTVAARFEKQGVQVHRYQPLESAEDARSFINQWCGKICMDSILLDIHAVPWLNSQELGALLEVNKCCRARGKRLILYAPRPKVQQLLETCRLLDYFDCAFQLSEVEGLVRNLSESIHGGTLYEEGRLTLELPLELTAATLSTYEKQARFLRKELQQQGLLKTIEVDAARLDFIDSSGLGFLLSLKKNTQRAGVTMSISNLPEKPRRIFEIARVDKLLLNI